MYKILLSIKPEYVKSIFEGKKKFEYRKIILIDSPNNLWKKTKKNSGVDKKFFFEYFKEKTIGVAYQLKNIVEYDEIRSLEEFGVKCAPQSYVYL